MKDPGSLEGPTSDVLCKRREFEVVCVFEKLEWLLGVKGNPPLSWVSPPDKEPIPILVLVPVTWHLFCVV